MAYGSTTFKQRSMAKRRPIRRRRARTVSRKRASSSTGSRLANKKRRIKPVSDLQKHVQVINHPYSLPGHPAKIPDGAVSHSLNRRMRYTGTVKNKQGEDTLHILLYAGFGIGAVAFNADGISPAASNTLPMGFTDQGMEMSFWALGAGLGTGHQNIVNQSQVSSWRPVSHAGRLTLDAVSEENNGYAEVVRITNPNNIVDHWGMAPLTNGSVDETKAAVVPQETAVTGMLPYLMGLALNQQPGYEQIPLKNLKDKEFKLNPLSSEIKFNQIEQRYNLEVGADTTYNAATDTLSFSRDNGAVHSLFDGILDNNHDMIYLRIHCRDNNGSTQFGSQLMVDIVQNSEFQLHPTSPFASFQHAAPKAAKNVTKIIDDANDNIRSSKSRVGT
ncbi:putative structure protein [Chaetoceros debilis DNA virus 83]|nr:putative structure protein [Chaetoceros debilis DNA virus 83]